MRIEELKIQKKKNKLTNKSKTDAKTEIYGSNIIYIHPPSLSPSSMSTYLQTRAKPGAALQTPPSFIHY